jgi:hypothetical protein
MHKVPRNFEIMDDATELLMRMRSGGERLKLVDAIFTSSRRLIAANVRQCHPDWSEKEIQEEVSRRVAGGSN